MFDSFYTSTTLHYEPALCTGCGLCSIVCPHGVFVQGNEIAELRYPERCIECGACQRNCALGAISVRAGVGCAAALMLDALRGRKSNSCDCDGQPLCCSLS